MATSPHPSASSNPKSPPSTTNAKVKPAMEQQQQQQKQQHIDALLERYLGLLDEYSRLRQELSQLQAGVYQNIARANFAGERGMRYGQDHYDERMQASRVLDIEIEGGSRVPAFAMTHAAARGASLPEDGVAGEAEQQQQQQQQQADSSDNDNGGTNDEDETEATGKKEEQEQENKKEKRQPGNNPLHWFGLFAPSALRTAQTQSVQAVERVIPRLVSVSAEMANIEIEVRRARKRRAKATLAAGNKDAAALSDGATAAATTTASSLPRAEPVDAQT